MANKDLPIHSYQREQRGARLVNCFAEQSSINQKSPVTVVGAPGIQAWVSVGDGPIRAMGTFDSKLYVVSGGGFYCVESDGDAVQLGSLLITGDVRLIPGRSDMLVIVGTTGYSFDGVTLSQITDADFPSPKDAAFTDGYMLVIERDTDRFWASELNDSSNWDGLQFATAESAPDKLVGIIVDHRQIILAGGDTVELWWNAGASGFPFERIPNGALEVGCSAGGSLAKADNGVFWLDDERIVRRLSDLTPVRVSQHGVEQAINKYTTVEDAQAFTYTEMGHIFYVLDFPTEQRTWVYDITTQEWHERQSYGVTNWRASAYARAYGKHFVADRNSARVGVLTSQSNAEWGDPLVAQWTYEAIYQDAKRIDHRSLEIVARRGVGGVTAPLISLEKSDDGGLTWQALPTRSLGAVGQYGARARWFQLGSAFERSYRASISDDVPRFIEATQVSAELGAY